MSYMKPTVASKPHIIVTVGIPGSGKSYFAEYFAKNFKAPIVSIDKLREKVFDKPTFSREEDNIVNQAATYMLDEVLKTGRTIIYDGRTDSRTDRDLIARKSRAAGYEPLFVWVQTEVPTAKKRAVKSKFSKKVLMSEEQFNTKVSKFSNPHPNEKFVVISGKHTNASQLRIVLKHLIDPNQTASGKPMQPTRPPGNRNFLIR